jgi:hypothetical protein
VERFIDPEVSGVVRTAVTIASCNRCLPPVYTKCLFSETAVSLSVPDFMELLIIYIPEGLKTMAAGVNSATHIDPHRKAPIITGNNAVKRCGIALLLEDLEKISDIVRDPMRFEVSLYLLELLSHRGGLLGRQHHRLLKPRVLGCINGPEDRHVSPYRSGEFRELEDTV